MIRALYTKSNAKKNFLIFFQRSIREMKFVRFYLRPKCEPYENVVLCVSNLPVMLDSENYYSFLKEIIQNG